MPDVDIQAVKESIHVEYELARQAFQELLNSMSDYDLKKPSLNSGWNNGQILFHVTFAFIILSSLLPMATFFGRLPKGFSRVFAWLLNGFTGPFNWINALGARGGGRVYGSKESLAGKFDDTCASLLRKLDSIKESSFRRGMYYPDKWDGLFKKYVTIEDIFRYPVRHFEFHLKQIER